MLLSWYEIIVIAPSSYFRHPHIPPFKIREIWCTHSIKESNINRSIAHGSMVKLPACRESVTIRPQNSSQAQNPKTSTPKPDRNLIIQNSKNKFAWDELSDFPCKHTHHGDFQISCIDQVVRSILRVTFICIVAIPQIVKHALLPCACDPLKDIKGTYACKTKNLN